MALPKIDAPVFEVDLPLSKKKIRFRPFLVKEQRNLMMAIESDDKETIEKNVRQVLHNCTLTENIDIDSLPITDVEYYFIQLRARSVGEVVENKYRCENVVNDKVCNNSMEMKLNLLDIKVDMNKDSKDIIQLTDKISIKLKYPQFSLVHKTVGLDSATDMAFQMIVESIEYIFDSEQYYYANESDPAELMQFVESLNQEQFAKIENFFENLPKLNKTMNLTCNKCGFNHVIDVEGLESFFG
jgi:T4 bacteriophage base plate protein